MPSFKLIISPHYDAQVEELLSWTRDKVSVASAARLSSSLLEFYGEVVRQPTRYPRLAPDRPAAAGIRVARVRWLRLAYAVDEVAETVPHRARRPT